MVICDQIEKGKCEGWLDKINKPCPCAKPHVKNFWCSTDCVVGGKLLKAKCVEIKEKYERV